MKTFFYSLETLAPFSIALALLMFAFIPSSAKAASSTYYVDIPNLSSYGIGGAVSYLCNGANCSVNGSSGNGYGGTNSAGQGYGSNPNNYPNYGYQYYQNPNPNSASNSRNYGGGTYMPVKANYTPYNWPSYSQYMKQANGTYRLVPQVVPTYAWNADNSLPSNVTGSGYGTGYNNGNTGRGFTMTSGF
jgi:hypothetical protein